MDCKIPGSCCFNRYRLAPDSGSCAGSNRTGAERRGWKGKSPALSLTGASAAVACAGGRSAAGARTSAGTVPLLLTTYSNY